MDLMKEGYVPSWCTACYRKGRTGEHFMKIAKAGCVPRAAASVGTVAWGWFEGARPPRASS